MPEKNSKKVDVGEGWALLQSQAVELTMGGAGGVSFCGQGQDQGQGQEAAFIKQNPSPPQTGKQGGSPPVFLSGNTPEEALSSAAGLALTGGRVTCFLSLSQLMGAAVLLQTLVARGVPLVVVVRGEGEGLQGAPLGHEGVFSLAAGGVPLYLAGGAQQALDLSLIAHRVAEQACVPVVVFVEEETAAGWETVHPPQTEIIQAFLGRPEDQIATTIPAQTMVFGPTRRRIPATLDLTQPLGMGPKMDEVHLSHSIAGPFLQAHLEDVMEEARVFFEEQTGRKHPPLQTQGRGGYLVLVEGGAFEIASRYAPKDVTVAALTQIFPFPHNAWQEAIKGKKGVTLLERTALPIGLESPLGKEVGLRQALARTGKKNSEENMGENTEERAGNTWLRKALGLSTSESAPPFYCIRHGALPLSPTGFLAAVDNMKSFGQPWGFVSHQFLPPPTTPIREIWSQTLGDAYPQLASSALPEPQLPKKFLPEAPSKETFSIQIEQMPDEAVFSSDDHPVKFLYQLTGLPLRARKNTTPNTSGLRLELGKTSEVFLPVAAMADVMVLTDIRLLNLVDMRHQLRAKGSVVMPGGTNGFSLDRLSREVKALLAEREIQIRVVDVASIVGEEGRGWDIPLDDLKARCLLGALVGTPAVLAFTGFSLKELARKLKTMLTLQMEEAPTVELDKNIRSYQRGWVESVALPLVSLPKEPTPVINNMPDWLKTASVEGPPLSDVNRFWAETAHLHARGEGEPVGPFLAKGLLPPGTGRMRDNRLSRKSHPRWLPKDCSGCGDCWNLCPEGAIVPKAVPLRDVLAAVAEKSGTTSVIVHLSRALRVMESKMTLSMQVGGDFPGPSVVGEETLAETKVSAEEKGALERELKHFTQAWGAFPLALNDAFYSQGRKVLSLSIDPGLCSGCMVCVGACPEKVLEEQPQDPESHARLVHIADLAGRLPPTDPEVLCWDAEAEEVPGLATLLMDPDAQGATRGGSAQGNASQILMRLVTGVMGALMKKRLAAFVLRLDELIPRLEGHLAARLAVDVSDSDALNSTLENLGQGAHTLAELSARLNREGTPLDQPWLERVSRTLSQLKNLRAVFEPEAKEGQPFSAMAALFSPAFAPVYPYNPHAFPWVTMLSPGSGAGALKGMTEGLFASLAEDLKWVRLAEMELEGGHAQTELDALLQEFSWRQFTPEEQELCPFPVLFLTGDEARFAPMADLLGAGLPVKVIVLNQGVSHALKKGGSPFSLGHIKENKTQPSVSIGTTDPALQALFQREVHVVQASLADYRGLLKGVLQGLKSPRPALFHLFAGSGAAGVHPQQAAQLALASRAHPHFVYNPDKGETPEDCLSLAGNPNRDSDWGPFPSNLKDGAGIKGGEEANLVTFAHFARYAMSQAEQGLHFKPITKDKGENASLAEFLGLSAEEQAETTPWIESVSQTGEAVRFSVSPPVVQAAVERMKAWRLLRFLARLDISSIDTEALLKEARGQVTEVVWQNLMELAKEGREGREGEGLSGVLEQWGEGN